jgi:putative nucleotidyltransferase with HDIG domain
MATMLALFKSVYGWLSPAASPPPLVLPPFSIKQASKATLPRVVSRRPTTSTFVPMMMKEMNQQSMRAISDVTAELPAFPRVTSELLQVLASPNASSEKIVRLVHTDPALAMSLIRAANAASHSPDEAVTRIDTAVMRLGYDAVQAIAMRGALAGTLRLQQRRSGGYDTNAIWRHSMATSIFAGMLAKRLPRMDSSEAVTAGLLHDIGKIVIDILYPTQAAELLSPATTHLGESMLAKEQRLLQACHTAFGAMVARHWKLPHALTMAIELHHHSDIELIDNLSLRDKQLVAVVFVSNQLAKIHGHPGADHEIDLPGERLMATINLPPDILKVADDVPKELLARVNAVCSA